MNCYDLSSIHAVNGNARTVACVVLFRAPEGSGGVALPGSCCSAGGYTRLWRPLLDQLENGSGPTPPLDSSSVPFQRLISCCYSSAAQTNTSPVTC